MNKLSADIFPPVLDKLVQKDKESGYLLSLVKLLLTRLNKVRKVKASVTNFSADCGGSFPPSLSEITIVAKVDGPNGWKIYANLDFFEMAIQNDPASLYDGHTPPATLQEEYISGRAIAVDTFEGDGEDPRVLPFITLEKNMLKGLGVANNG